MSRPLLAFALVVLGAAGLAPIVVMFARAFVEPAAFAEVLDPRTLDLLGRTCLLGGSVVLIALGVGVPFGFLTARTNVPGASILRPLGLVPLLLPPLVLAAAWTAAVPQVRGAPMTIFLLGLGTAPIVALFVAKAAGRVDSRREEAALLVGGIPGVLRMELPLIAPAAACGACFAFVFAVNDFAVPDYVSSVGRKFNVYADEVFASWQVDRRDAQAVATAVPLVLLTLVTLLPALALRRRGALATIDSDFQKPAPIPLGWVRWPAFLFCVAFVAAGAALPLGRLVFEAGGGRTVWSIDKLVATFGLALERSRDNLLASLLFSFAAATAAAPIAFVLGHAIVRGRRGRWLEWLVVLPIAVPAILFGIGTIAVWNHPWSSSFYTGGGLVVLMLVGRYLAFPTLVSAGSVASFDRELEDAAELAGTRPAMRLTRIVAPNVRSSLLGGWVMVFVLSMRELDAAILVPAANQMVMFKLFNAVHFGRDDFVAAMALLIVFATVLPALLWALFSNRRLEVLP